MLEKLLGACYLLSLGVMARNLIRIKLQNDFEEELKKYREYDLSTDKILRKGDETDLRGKFVVLAKHKADPDTKTPFFTHT